MWLKLYDKSLRGKKPPVKQLKLSNKSQETLHWVGKIVKRITENKNKISNCLYFMGDSVSLCCFLLNKDLMCALSDLAFSLNLGTSICRLVARLQTQRTEQKFNLLWLGMVQWRCTGIWWMKRLLSEPLVWRPGPQVSWALGLSCLRNHGTSWHFLHLWVFHLE